ncbi:MAG: DUF3098 domain-containing protein [Bacteroidales bacterium]|nr:DUF3098 domain-containing protein [Bacteroidales bacterium]
MNTKNTVTSKGFKETKPEFQFAFTKENYIYMAIGVALLLLGYILLIGGGAKDSDTFNYALFNTRRLVIAPILIVGGLVVEVYAIMKKTSPKKEFTQEK